MAKTEMKRVKSGSSPKNRSESNFENRMTKRDEERVRKREARRKKVRMQKIIVVVSAIMIVAVIVFGVVFTRPSLKLTRALNKGDKYTEMADYDNARTYYEHALELDASCVKAYRRIADNYVKQEKIAEAEQILYAGWKQTQDEGLLHYYCVEVHNEAVEDINQDNCTFATLDKCIQVLELEADNEETLELMQSYCYDELFEATQEQDMCLMFLDADESQDTCSYEEYEQLLRRLLTLYEVSPTEEIKRVLTRYAVIDVPYVRISMPHVDAYTVLLADINDKVHDSGIADTLACLHRAKEVREYFETAFTEFESGNYAYARELLVEESYQQLRDGFIEENSGYWEGSTYIPVNQEQLVLHREEESVRFYFPDVADYESNQGIINVWGTHQEDDGVQRSVISYEPVAEDGEDSHIEYTMQYLYSNVKIGGEYVPQMNFRIDTKVTTQDGTTTNAIGDWGGEHEWEIDY